MDFGVESGILVLSPEKRELSSEKREPSSEKRELSSENMC
ncbi:hypothetical protein SAMN05877753_101561 [Bacillus oleivorans]|uniref:Uncharacterized protein n=1 Tax=Bacillus oleivorans TaxID=1448271 RepID=A0A285CI18_9BACI|nr:hypothetical protein SAMN05877753_101561 [Bacillus oleivorans]